MLGGYRFIDITFRVLIGGIAAVIVAFIVHVATSNYAEISKVYAAYQANAEKDQKETEESIQDNCIGIAPAPSIACINNYLTAYYKKQSTNADLKAQQDMAQWAFMTFLASLGGVLVGIGGIVYVRLTLREAKETTRIGQRGLDIARENAEKELRAYVYSDHVEATGIYGEEDEFTGISIRYRWLNAGQTPAHNLGLRIAINVVGIQPDGSFPSPESIGTEPLAEHNKITVLGQGGVMSTSKVSLPARFVKEIADGKVVAFVRTRADYTDVFGSAQYTEQCNLVEVLVSYDEIAADTAEHPIGFQIFGSTNKST